MKEKKRFFMLAGILLVMIATFTSMVLVSEYTRTRLIQRKQDEVKAYYTALYFDSTGEGSAIAIDNNVGYVSFNLMNFIGEDVTERDIAYEITAPTAYYTNNNLEIDPAHYSSNNLSSEYSGADNTLNVRDVWGQPTVVGRETYKYSVEVTDNNGEKYDEVYPSDPITGGTSATDYLFKYEKLEGSGSANAVGKTHNVTLKLTRDDDYDSINGTENISIVIQLLKPYKEVFIINMTISERLIVFSNTTTTEFETEIEELHIQTADIFSHLSTKSDGTNYDRRKYKLEDGTNTTTKGFAAKPLKVTLTWDNLILNEILVDKLPDSVVDKNQLSSLSSDSGSIVLMIPQSSSFKLQFYPTDSTYSVTARVDIIDATINSSGTYIETPYYVLYDKYFGGYTPSELIQKDNTEILVLNETKEGLVH